jgi:hypothetical protein
MRKIAIGVFVGVAALAAVVTALASGQDDHVMKLHLPDGSTAQIAYEGDIAPHVAIVPAHALVPVGWFDPFAIAPVGPLDQLAADIGLQTDKMVQQMRSRGLQPNADGRVDVTAFGALPAGTVRYSFVSSSTDEGVCSRSVQVTSFGPGHPPKVVANSSGECRTSPPVSTTALSNDQNQAPPATAGRITTDHEPMFVQTI